jgi:hypothetical protein
MWSQPAPQTYGKHSPPARSPALNALKNLVGQFKDAEPVTLRRQLAVEVTTSGAQPEVFQGENGHPALYYREMFVFLPFQLSRNKFLAATYIMSYDITRPPPPMDFSLDIRGIDGAKAQARYYDPIKDAELPTSIDARRADGISLTVEQVEYPRLILIEER